MKDIVLNDQETGYDALEKYIRRFWSHQIFDDLILSIATSYDGVRFDRRNVLVELENYNGILFVDDWWEGEKFIRLYGILAVSEIEIPQFGIYEE